MELYVIKNDEGRYYDAFSEEFTSVMEAGGVYVIYGAKQAKRIAKEANAHVVELIEKPKPIEVSEEDAEKLKAIDEGHTWGDYVKISYGFFKTFRDAMKYGYTVKKEQKYKVKVPHVEDMYYGVMCNNELSAVPALTLNPVMERMLEFTEQDIKDLGLGDCEKVEVEE